MRASSKYMFELSNYNSWDNGNITIECTGTSYSRFKRYNWSSARDISITPNYADGTWHMFTWVGASWIYYIDGVQKWTNSTSVSIKPAEITIWWWRLSNTSYTGDYSDLIIEDRVRSASEILNHYNTYKSNYGL